MATKKTSKIRKTDTKPVQEIRFVNEQIPVPEGNSERHLFKVTLVVLADSRCGPDQVLTHVMGGCLRHPISLPVVDGYGAEVKNLTLTGPSRRKYKHGGAVYCTGFKNKPVPKDKVPVIQIVE